MKLRSMITLVLVGFLCAEAAAQSTTWITAAKNAGQAAEAFNRARRVVYVWYDLRGEDNFLLPRAKDQRMWTGNDNGADQWSHFFNTTWLTDRPALGSFVRETLIDEIRLTTRVGRLVDRYYIDKNAFLYSTPNMDQVIFDSAEYVKDGLLSVIDLTGSGVMLDRARGLTEDIMKIAPVSTRYGHIPGNSAEVCGDMLQNLTRLYGATGDPRYKKWAEKIGEAWMMEVLPANNGMPVHRWDFSEHEAIDDHLSFNDHGNEIISGLTELLLLEKVHDTTRYNKYLPILQRMIDQMLAIAVNEHGLFVSSIRPRTKEKLGNSVPDTWAYTQNAVYAMYIATGKSRYRDAVVRALTGIATQSKYTNWGTFIDSWCDSIEGGILHYNRIRDPKLYAWIEKMAILMLRMQQSDGFVMSTYLDGNYCRTSLMWALMQTAGTYAENWREDLRLGAVVEGGTLKIYLKAASNWSGKLHIDAARHRINMGLGIDYPRINQWPQWYVVEPANLYEVSINGKKEAPMLGDELINGLAVAYKGTPLQITIRMFNGGPPYGD